MISTASDTLTGLCHGAVRLLLVTAAVGAICLTHHSATLMAQQLPPLRRADFAEVAPQGFGDRQNSWAWSMAWFQGKLYVGTQRSFQCVYAAAIDLLYPAYPPT